MTADPDLEHNSSNGLHCYYDHRHGVSLERLNDNFARLMDITEKRDAWSQARETWMNEYVNRTMPIKSHFWILLGSLTILAGFAAAIEMIQKMTP